MRSTEYKKYLDSPKWQITREKWFAANGKGWGPGNQPPPFLRKRL